MKDNKLHNKYLFKILKGIVVTHPTQEKKSVGLLYWSKYDIKNTTLRKPGLNKNLKLK